MKKFQKLERFPLGAIHAEGFLKDQMMIGKDGICGHLHELEPEMIAYPFIDKRPVPAWDPKNQSGWGAEISGNYWTAYIQFAYTLNDPDMIARATEWVDTMMKKQRADGYLGTFYEEDADIYHDYNAWGTTCAMRGLIAFYEATGREDVLHVMHRCMLWFCETWAGDRKTVWAGPSIIEPMIFIYHLTGDRRLLDFAEDYLEAVCKNDLFKLSYKALLEDKLYYNATHAVGYGNKAKLPALVYTATGKDEYLRASVNAFEKVYPKSIQLTGGPAGDSEFLSPISSIAETEYCTFAVYQMAYSHMSYITGDPKYGDRIEEIFYNGAQGGRKKDEKAIAYMTSPNQIYATEHSSRAHMTHQAYAPAHRTSCCAVNAVMVVPEFVRAMLLRDGEDGVYFMAYGPCSLDDGNVSLNVKTLYPFRNTVTLEILSSKALKLHLRIPSYAKGYELVLNGEVIKAAEENGYIVLDRSFAVGDTVSVSFKTEVEVLKVDDSDGPSKFPIAIRYGALLFAYHIPERWSVTAGRPMTPLPDGWHWYNVYPRYKDVEISDKLATLGHRYKQITWNIALDENLKAEDFEIEELEEDGYVWANPILKLHTHAYKAPYMIPPYSEATYETYGAYQEVVERIPLTLEPYGCTNLRISYFPKAKL